MNKIITSAIAAAIALTMASCSDGEDYQIITRSYNQCFGVITTLDAPEAAPVIKSQVGMEVKFRIDFNHHDKNIAEVLLLNVPMGNGDYAHCSLTNVNYEVTAQRTWLINASGIKADNCNALFDNLYIEVIDRTLGNASYPIYKLSYTVNSKYHVTVFAKEYRYFGTTSMTPLADAVMPLEPYSTTKTSYILQFSDDLTKADLYLNGAQFASTMPKPIDMVFNSIPVTYGKDSFTLNGADIIPTSGGDPYPMFKILTINGTGTNAGNLNGAFTVNGLGTVKCELTPFATE